MLAGVVGPGALAFDCLYRLVEEIHDEVFAQNGLRGCECEEGGGGECRYTSHLRHNLSFGDVSEGLLVFTGSALSSWKVGAESCSIWARVRAMAVEGRYEAALHLMGLHMLDEPQSRSKLSAEEQQARQVSWWVLAKAVAGQLGAREALALVEKGHVEVQRNGAAAECFKELQRRPLLPEPEPQQRSAPSSPQRELPTHNYEGSASMAAAVLAGGEYRSNCSPRLGFQGCL